MWSRIFPEESAARFWFKLLFRELAIVASLVAVAGPRFGTEVEQVTPRGSDLYVLIDVSKSMLAEDVVPSRLERAKADVSALLNRIDGERVGLIAFAGQAVVKCPLTVDYDSFRRALQELDPSSAPRGGTAIGDAIRKALEVFHTKAERDQSLLLITDGDDQKSYPLEAAALAAERNVAIFTVGLGDSEQGARIPQQGNSKNYVEYEGEQIWSKLDGSLLSEIALKTSGVYVPAGTKSYDLAELYTEHLQKRRATNGESQQRIRRSEQFQWFLGIALAALFVDFCLAPYRRAKKEPNMEAGIRLSKVANILLLVSASFGLVPSGRVLADEPRVAVREGLKLYSQEKYDAAQEKFATAVDLLEASKSESLAIAAFDNACAYHRKGEPEKARENYLQAGLSQNRKIATTAHFNLGNLSAEQARTAAGEQPELLPSDKRQAVLDQLKQAVDAYRHCLELQPDHVQSRRNLELVRLWVKYYSDKWREVDRQKRRDESNLLVFLEYLMTAQQGLKESTQSLPTNTTSDGFAELKLVQDELREEIPTLREKIENDLKPQTNDPQGSAANNTANRAGASDEKELAEGIRLLQGWADAAGVQMALSSKQLGLRAPAESVANQQAALEEFDKIWDAIIPFHPLLAKELIDQTAIAGTLKPNSVDVKEESIDSNEDTSTVVPNEPSTEEDIRQAPPVLQIADGQVPELKRSQERTLRKARMLVPKAEMELKQLESAAGPKLEQQDPPRADEGSDPSADASVPKQIDPAEVKAGLEKAIELAPKAVSEMESAIESLNQKEWQKAYAAAEEARRILEEIQQAQPKNEQQNQDDQQQQEQNKQQNEQEQDKDQDDPSKDNKSDEKQEKPKDEPKSDQQKSQDQKQSKPDVSPERIAEALRKVRERQQEKQDRDRQMRAQILGRAPVDKDW